MAAQSMETIAGVAIPDSALTREATDCIRSAEDELLFDHSRGVFLLGVLWDRRLGLQPDLELLYVAAMFHDLGLTERYRTSNLRFEIDAASAARDFLSTRAPMPPTPARYRSASRCTPLQAYHSFSNPRSRWLTPVLRPMWSASAEMSSHREISQRSPLRTRARISSAACWRPSPTA
jgi:hypothetical protein